MHPKVKAHYAQGKNATPTAKWLYNIFTSRVHFVFAGFLHILFPLHYIIDV